MISFFRVCFSAKSFSLKLDEFPHSCESVGRWRSSIEARTAPAQSPVPPSPLSKRNHTNSIADIVDNDLLPETVKNTTSSHRKTLKKQSELAHLIVCCERGSFFSIVVVVAVVVGSVSSSNRKTASFYAAKHINIQMSRSCQYFCCDDDTLFSPSVWISSSAINSQKASNSQRSTHTEPKARNFVQGLSNLFFHAVSTLHLTPSMKKAEKKNCFNDIARLHRFLLYA